MVSLEDLEFKNKKFWTGFIISSFPTSLNEETDMTLYELIEENEMVHIDINWWNDFTKYYDGVFEEAIMAQLSRQKSKTFIMN